MENTGSLVVGMLAFVNSSPYPFLCRSSSVNPVAHFNKLIEVEGVRREKWEFFPTRFRGSPWSVGITSIHGATVTFTLITVFPPLSPSLSVLYLVTVFWNGIDFLQKNGKELWIEMGNLQSSCIMGFGIQLGLFNFCHMRWHFVPIWAKSSRNRNPYLSG